MILLASGLMISLLRATVFLALSAALSAAVFVVGGLFFRRLKRGFADVL